MPSDPHGFSLLQYAQQFRLHGNLHGVQFIQKQRSVLRQLKQAFRVHRAGIGSPDRTEQDAFQEILRYCRAVYRYKRFLSSLTEIMDALGKNFFSGSGLTDYQEITVYPGNCLGIPDCIHQSLALPDNIQKRIGGIILLLVFFILQIPQMQAALQLRDFTERLLRFPVILDNRICQYIFPMISKGVGAVHQGTVDIILRPGGIVTVFVYDWNSGLNDIPVLMFILRPVIVKIGQRTVIKLLPAHPVVLGGHLTDDHDFALCVGSHNIKFLYDFLITFALDSGIVKVCQVVQKINHPAFPFLRPAAVSISPR